MSLALVVDRCECPVFFSPLWLIFSLSLSLSYTTDAHIHTITSFVGLSRSKASISRASIADFPTRSLNFLVQGLLDPLGCKKKPDGPSSRGVPTSLGSERPFSYLTSLSGDSNPPLKGLQVAECPFSFRGSLLFPFPSFQCFPRPIISCEVGSSSSFVASLQPQQQQQRCPSLSTVRSKLAH